MTAFKFQSHHHSNSKTMQSSSKTDLCQEEQIQKDLDLVISCNFSSATSNCNINVLKELYNFCSQQNEGKSTGNCEIQ